MVARNSHGIPSYFLTEFLTRNRTDIDKTLNFHTKNKPTQHLGDRNWIHLNDSLFHLFLTSSTMKHTTLHAPLPLRSHLQICFFFFYGILSFLFYICRVKTTEIKHTLITHRNLFIEFANDIINSHLSPIFFHIY